MSGDPVHAASEVPRTEPTATVLVAEDEPAVRSIAVRVLERQGFRVLQARDGRDALDVWESARAAGTTIDVVVSDVVMPRMGGRELLALLRQDAPSLPVILTSGYDDAAGAGATPDGVLTLPKPFTADALAAAVRRALAARAADGRARGARASDGRAPDGGGAHGRGP